MLASPALYGYQKSRLPLFLTRKKNKTRLNKRGKKNPTKQKQNNNKNKKGNREKRKKTQYLWQEQGFFSETVGWFYVLSMIQYICVRRNICQNNIGLFTYKMHILAVISLLDFWKPYLKLTHWHGQRLPVITERVDLRLPLWMAFLDSLHHAACIPVISRKLKIGSTVEWGSAAVPTLFFHQIASKCC